MRIPFPWGRREELHLLAADPAPLCGRLRGARVRAQPHREGEGIRGMVQLLLPGDPIWLQEGGLDAPPLGVGSRERASSYQWVGGGGLESQAGDSVVRFSTGASCLERL